ncbi:unnamed protein product [Polarella glacialis]|uniref:Uncharacterized protein n=2 Tax=Polarella glacialis TaxID=89957 RepID=A0A813LNC2_POLGL|nr:unnamed protein product [Polarella glacialis]
MYLAFLLVQPFLPDSIAQKETLMDGFIFPGAAPAARLAGKRQGFRTFVPKVIACVGFHALLSLSSFAASALAYKYHAVQVAWILCVLVGCMIAGARFYYQSAHPDYVPPGQLWGLARIAVAWAVLLPTYLVTEGYLPLFQ